MPGAATPALVFDLDNTLYPATCRLFDQIERRMTDFVAMRFSLSDEQAYNVQKKYFHDYGTTLAGLMAEHAVDADEFMDYVHDINLSGLPANDTLHRHLASYEGRKIVYTNGSAKHAQNILRHMDMDGLFDAVFDIKASAFRPKPCTYAFAAMLETCDVAPQNAIMFDDIPRNLKPAADVGMTTVWVCDAANQYSHLQSQCGAPPASYIHHTITSLNDWFDNKENA